MERGDINAALGGRLQPADKDIDYEKERRKIEKPFWLRGIRCKCGSQRLEQVRGEYDEGNTPRKIKCKVCGIESNFCLSIDSVLRDFGRLTNQELWKGMD